MNFTPTRIYTGVAEPPSTNVIWHKPTNTGYDKYLWIIDRWVEFTSDNPPEGIPILELPIGFNLRGKKLLITRKDLIPQPDPIVYQSLIAQYSDGQEEEETSSFIAIQCDDNVFNFIGSFKIKGEHFSIDKEFYEWGWHDIVELQLPDIDCFVESITIEGGEVGENYWSFKYAFII